MRRLKPAHRRRAPKHSQTHAYPQRGPVRAFLRGHDEQPTGERGPPERVGNEVHCILCFFSRQLTASTNDHINPSGSRRTTRGGGMTARSFGEKALCIPDCGMLWSSWWHGDGTGRETRVQEPFPTPYPGAWQEPPRGGATAPARGRGTRLERVSGASGWWCSGA